MEEESGMIKEKALGDIRPRVIICSECGSVFEEGYGKPCIHLQVLAEECRSWSCT